jgi:N,N'-diacetylchitobiose transport system substrate-binding protein
MRIPKIAAASAAALLVTACGGGTDAGDADSLTVWVMGTSEDALVEYFDGIEERFQEHHPGTSVDVEFIPWDDAQECAKCGGRMVRTGSCYTCRDCGQNTGCS